MDHALLSVAFLTASVLFVLSLRGLSSQQTSRRGNTLGMVGMAIAVLATTLAPEVDAYVWLLGSLAVGGAVGALMAARVAMTALPELVALLHSFVGLAAVLVGLSTYLDYFGHGYDGSHGPAGLILGEIALDVLIGAITFTGSVLAFLKLRGSVSGKPLLLPARHLLNLALLGGAVACSVLFGRADDVATGLPYLLIATALAAVLGVHLVAAIGGADMPVVVSLLNSYSGWTASAAGFMLGSDLLIITGALVGSSGAILSIIMCRAMNRSILSVVFGGFGGDTGKKPAAAAPTDAPAGEVTECDPDGTAGLLLAARSVVIVPGYGMAVARAQHAVREMTDLLRARGCKVRFAIHPVAGRLPGHMNVLLAEANVPYDIVLEMEDINEDMEHTDVVLVIGANDIVNPSAETDPASPIWGMPVLQVWKAATVVMNKRSRGAGYAGIDNPLFVYPNTRMLFGDARASAEAVVAGLRQSPAGAGNPQALRAAGGRA